MLQIVEAEVPSLAQGGQEQYVPSWLPEGTVADSDQSGFGRFFWGTDYILPDGGVTKGYYGGTAPLAGIGKVASKGRGIWKSVKTFFGKPNPTRLNRGGIPQPRNPVTQRWLKYEANPGLKQSPAAYFSSGFGQGYASMQTGAEMVPAVTNAQRVGQAMGQFVGGISSIFGP